MIVPLPDGRFRVTVERPHNVRRTRTCRSIEAARFFEAIFMAGWFDDIPNRRNKKYRKPRMISKPRHWLNRFIRTVL